MKYRNSPVLFGAALLVLVVSAGCSSDSSASKGGPSQTEIAAQAPTSLKAQIDQVQKDNNPNIPPQARAAIVQSLSAHAK